MTPHESGAPAGSDLAKKDRAGRVGRMTVRPSLLLGFIAASGLAARAEEIKVSGAADISGAAAVAVPAKTPAVEKNDAKPSLPDPRAFLFEAKPGDFSAASYAGVVEALIANYEKTTGRTLKPGKFAKAGLKLYTASGSGLATPHALTDAVVVALEKRGFRRESVLLIDQDEARLRDAGYLPTLRGAADDFKYKGSPVLALDTGKYYDPKPDSPWVWPSPLPSKDVFPDRDNFSFTPDKSERYSRLPMPLIKQVDFWINLPMACDNAAVGVSGALTNATLYNVSNARRFWDNPANAQKAVIEIAAIPEIKDRMEFTIMPLQAYQFVGGPRFDAAFTVSEKRVWLSANPVVLDYLMWRRFNDSRKTMKFDPIEPEPQMFVAANSGEIRLGSCRAEDIRLVEVK